MTNTYITHLKGYKTIKEKNIGVAFGWFRRIFTQQNKTQKSYSSYPDNLEEIYGDILKSPIH